LGEIHLPRDALHVRGGQLMSVGHDSQLIPGVFFFREHIDNEKPLASHRASSPPESRLPIERPSSAAVSRGAGAELWQTLFAWPLRCSGLVRRPPLRP